MKNLIFTIFFLNISYSFASNVNQFVENREIFINDRGLQILAEKNAIYPQEKRKLSGSIQSVESKAAYFDESRNHYDRYRIEVQRAQNGVGVASISEAAVQDFGKHIETNLATARFDANQNLISRTHCDSTTTIDRGVVSTDKKVESTCSTYTKDFCDLYRNESASLKLIDRISDADIKKCSDVMEKLSSFFGKFKEELKANIPYSNIANAEKARMQEFGKRSMEKVGLFKDSFTDAVTDKGDALSKHGEDGRKAWHGWSSIYEFEKIQRRCDQYFAAEASPTAAAPAGEATRREKATR